MSLDCIELTTTRIDNSSEHKSDSRCNPTKIIPSKLKNGIKFLLNSITFFLFASFLLFSPFYDHKPLDRETWQQIEEIFLFVLNNNCRKRHEDDSDSRRRRDKMHSIEPREGKRICFRSWLNLTFVFSRLSENALKRYIFLHNLFIQRTCFRQDVFQLGFSGSSVERE